MVCNAALNFDSKGHVEFEEASLISHDKQIMFNMEELLAETENFHHDNKLGEGGFGSVYKVKGKASILII